MGLRPRVLLRLALLQLRLDQSRRHPPLRPRRPLQLPAHHLRRRGTLRHPHREQHRLRPHRRRQERPRRRRVPPESRVRRMEAHRRQRRITIQLAPKTVSRPARQLRRRLQLLQRQPPVLRVGQRRRQRPIRTFQLLRNRRSCQSRQRQNRKTLWLLARSICTDGDCRRAARRGCAT